MLSGQHTRRPGNRLVLRGVIACFVICQLKAHTMYTLAYLTYAAGNWHLDTQRFKDAWQALHEAQHMLNAPQAYRDIVLSHPTKGSITF